MFIYYKYVTEYLFVQAALEVAAVVTEPSTATVILVIVQTLALSLTLAPVATPQ